MDATALRLDLAALGLRPGDVVLVHSSLLSLGWVEGGAELVVDTLLDVVSPRGTVLLPGLTGSANDSRENPPHADLRADPAPWVGKIPAAANRRAEAHRSIHPTHSVIALGASSYNWTEGHERCDTPCGPDSPYHRLTQGGGKILLLGCGQSRNTSLHMVEELAGVPYHLLPDAAVGTVVDREGFRHSIPTRLHRWGVARAYERMDSILGPSMKVGSVGKATARLIEANANLRLGLALLKANPHGLCA